MPDYDPLSAVMVTDPYPTYSELRDSAPVFWSDRLDSWVLTRYEDCRAVLGDAANFASDWRRAGHESASTVMSMQALDPPDHTPIRRLFTTAFRDQDLDHIGDMALAETTELLEKFSTAEEFDFTAELARPVALSAVCGCWVSTSRRWPISPPSRTRWCTAWTPGCGPRCWSRRWPRARRSTS
ncbi:hypothetical protein ACFQ0T_13805 [Kitasatospora gansuensis]